MFLSTSSPLFILVLCGVLYGSVSSTDLLPRADSAKKDPDPECTVTNPTTGEFYDLRPLIRRSSDKFHTLKHRTVLNSRTDWVINGQDYGHNFTVNICEPLMSDHSDVVNVNDRTNVSGYYIDSGGRKISIG